MTAFLVQGTVTAFTGIMMTANVAFAGADCARIGEELKAMQKATQNISASLVSNHEAFATVLEEHAESLKENSTTGPSGGRSVVNKMNESAEAFRQRGQNAQKLNKRLNQASDQVIAKAVACLKSK